MSQFGGFTRWSLLLQIFVMGSITCLGVMTTVTDLCHGLKNFHIACKQKCLTSNLCLSWQLILYRTLVLVEYYFFSNLSASTCMYVVSHFECWEEMPLSSFLNLIVISTQYMVRYRITSLRIMTSQIWPCPDQNTIEKPNIKIGFSYNEVVSRKYINFRYVQKGWWLSSPSCVHELLKKKSSMSDK